MIKTVIFDLWGTLSIQAVSISKSLREHFNIDIHAGDKQYERAIQLTQWNSLEELAEAILKAYNLALNKENISFVAKTVSHKIAQSQPIKGIEVLLGELQKNVRLAILSNTSIFESKIISQWGFEKYFSVQQFSWQTKLLKPNPQCYKNILDELSLAAEEVVLIDDNKENCIGAQEIGIKAVQFIDIAHLRASLKKLGVL